jgi:hypothetical protein
MAVWYRADKTIAAINAMIEHDGGNTWRAWMRHTMPALPDAYRDDEKPFRGHMGASGIGDECPRKVWLSFHWATQKKYPARLIRLFNRGHLEEGRCTALLLATGIKVYQTDANGKQYRISGAAGHYGGSGDGVAVGVPDLPAGVPCLLEFKTSNTKDFNEMSERGVKDANFKHYVQMQQYMGGFGLKYALYDMVCKETDELHMEIVPFDEACYKQFQERAELLVFMPTPPKGIGSSPGFFKCKFCDHNKVCHKLSPPARNCRTCINAVPTKAGGGEWSCNVSGSCIAIPMDVQYNGCPQYQQNPAI